MNVRRTFILAMTSAIALASLPAIGQVPAPKADTHQDVKVVPAGTPTGPQPPNRIVPSAPQPIVKPADPARVKATYEINGARVPITEGDFYDAAQRIEKLEKSSQGRAVDSNRVFEHMLAFAEAKAFGLEATPEEVALFDPLEKNKDLAAATWARYEKEGVTKEMYATYQKELRTIQKAKDLFANSLRVLSSDVFEAYRRDHFTMRLEYVEFPASRYVEEFKTKPPTDQELEAFFKEDKGVQARYLKQATQSAEFVSFDPKETTQAVPDERTIERAEALAYYNQNKARLDTLLTAEQKAALYPPGKVDIADLKTPFQLLRPVIDREIRLSAKIRAAFEDAKKAGANFEAIAKQYGLTYERVENVDRESMTVRYSKYGPQIFSVLSALNPNDMSTELKIEPQLQYFYRLISKEASKLPDFETVKAKILPDYIERTSLTRAQQAAQAMRSFIDQKVDAEVRAEEQRLLGEAETTAQNEIKTKGVAEAKEMEAIRARYRTQAGAKVRAMKDTLAPKFFDAYVKDNNLKVSDTGLFELGSIKRDVGDQMRIMVFLKQNPQLRSMEPGQITQVMTDAASKTQVIARVAERAEPDYSKMSDGDLLAIRAQTERAQSYQPVQRWQFADISRRRDLKVE
jgi:hypothetical protein